ncbi:MAG: hypothetical protein K0Q79_1921 [Flavipsychrobacter sp.]|jgi:hypothetical protein|nr:hypothetical protein [Flavipsychrobacter sp.]
MKKTRVLLSIAALVFNMSVNAQPYWNGSTVATTTSGNCSIQGGQIDLSMPLDGTFRNINANSNTAGLTLNSGTGSRIELYAGTTSSSAGSISLVTQGPSGPSGSPNGVSYYYQSGPSYTQLMHIWNDGKVTIGSGLFEWSENMSNKTPGSYKLFVEEGILTEKLKVAMVGDAANWSDFVFNKDYNLMPLCEVEEYVKANKHLPEIPSANEVKENGIDVAVMDAKLLQKIEELTLYVIEQQKEIKKQQDEIRLIKAKMN